MPCKDTIKVGNSRRQVERTLQRSRLWAVQTPQIFTADQLRRHGTFVAQNHLAVTDDASIAEAMGVPVQLVPGSY